MNFADIKFTDFADSLPQIVWATDPDGKNIYFNDAWMEYTGMSLAESLGDGWNKPFHPDDQQRAWEAWANATKNLAEYSLECRLRKSDGSYQWWLIRGIPVINHYGKIVRWFGTCTDINQMKITFDDLAKEKATLQSVFDSSPDGMAVIRVDGNFDTFNRHYMSYFHADTESRIGNFAHLMERFEFFTLEGQPIAIDDLPSSKALKGKSTFSQEMQIREKVTGRTWYGSHSAAPIQYKGSNITAAVICVRDITEGVKDKVKLKNTVLEQERILNSQIAGIARTKNRQFVWVNSCYADYFGYAPDELIGQSTRILYPDEQSFKAFAKVIEKSHSVVSGQTKEVIQLQKKDGSLGYFFIGGGPITKGSDESIWISFDVTEDQKNKMLIGAYVERLEKAMNETLLVLSKTVEMHDPYTVGHQNRVGLIAKEIGMLMGMPEKAADRLRLAGLVHDIGKLAVPAQILSKPGKLTDEELSLVRSHARIGHEILKNVNFDIPVAEVAYQHHERGDGSGYPRGLTQNNILLEARIIAVADVVEAMTNRRPYRGPLGLDKALAEIEGGRGTKYDPEVVDACLKLFREDMYSLEDIGN